MDESKGDMISKLRKSVEALGRNIKTPSILQRQGILPPDPKNSIGVPVGGTGVVRVLMYFIAGLLVVGLLLLGVDQWVTPIFQRSPGSAGYIPIPGTDLSQNFWLTPASVQDIVVGTPAPPTVVPGAPAPPPVLSVQVIEAQTSYSLTMDVLIKDEYPQQLGNGQTQRVFFTMSQSVENPSLRIGLDNSKNTVYITCFDSNGLQQSVILDNVPIHVPFRVGVVISPYAIEGYLNGLLVQTRQLNTTPIAPTSGDKIFAPSSIVIGGKTLSNQIKVLNMRAFGYSVPASEMKGRMDDLFTKEQFTQISLARY